MHRFSPKAKRLISSSLKSRRRHFINRKLNKFQLEDDHPFYFHPKDPMGYA